MTGPRGASGPPPPEDRPDHLAPERPARDQQIPDTDQDPEDMDRALFRERTELAWHRTGIAFAALGGVVIKTSPPIGLIILALSVVIFVLGHTSRSLPLITIAVTAVSIVALVLAFFDGDPPFPPH